MSDPNQKSEIGSQKWIEVAAGLVFHEGRLLITQRPEGAHLAGLWEFPGGKREPGETFEACLVRELREELGMEVAVGELLADMTHAYPEKTVRLKFFRCGWTSGEPRALGCAAWRWVAAEDLKDEAFPPADRQLLRRLRSSPGLWRGGT